MERQLVDPSGNSFMIYFISIILLVFVNAVVSACEIAFVSVNQSSMYDLVALGDKRAKRVLKLLNQSEQLLASLQVAITLSGFFAVALTAIYAVDIFLFNTSELAGMDALLLFGVILIVSFVFIVLGELYPKRIAIQKPDEIALEMSGIITFLVILSTPFVWLTTTVSSVLQMITPINFDETTEKFTREEMQAIIEESRDEGSIDGEEFSMLEGVLSLDNKIAKEIMVPRPDIQMIDIDDDNDVNIDIILDSPYSRIPLYQTDRDNIIGIIHAKTLLKTMRYQDVSEIDLLHIANSPMFVPATIYIDDLLIDFKRQQQHMGVLIDEFGGVEGIVTLEDLLEEIVGEIDDENDVYKAHEVHKVDDTHYVVNAGIDIDDFNAFFNVSIQEDNIDTLAGAIIRETGYVPSESDDSMLRVQKYVINPELIENGRIISVRVTYDPDHSIETKYHLREDMTVELQKN